MAALAAAAALLIASATPAKAGHGGADVTVSPGGCGETTISAKAPGNTVTNMYLVVEAEGQVQSENIPTDGSSATIGVGPFYTHAGVGPFAGSGSSSEIVSWRVFGGAERNYDIPHWNGFGTPGFTADIVAYFNQVGGFGWVLSGTDDPNPFTTWNMLNVGTCEITRRSCKRGGYAGFGFRNQGLCIRYANTGRDSR